MIATPFTTAGKIPAAKSPPIEILAMTPIIIRSIAGGTSVETPPAAAKTAVANSGGYFNFFIAGIATEPIAAVFALGEPEIPDISIVENITTKANPPRICPTNINNCR